MNEESLVSHVIEYVRASQKCEELHRCTERLMKQIREMVKREELPLIIEHDGIAALVSVSQLDDGAFDHQPWVSISRVKRHIRSKVYEAAPIAR